MAERIFGIIRRGFGLDYLWDLQDSRANFD